MSSRSKYFTIIINFEIYEIETWCLSAKMNGFHDYKQTIDYWNKI